MEDDEVGSPIHDAIGIARAIMQQEKPEPLDAEKARRLARGLLLMLNARLVDIE